MKIRLVVLAMLIVISGVVTACKGGPKPPHYATPTAIPYPGYP